MGDGNRMYSSLTCGWVNKIAQVKCLQVWKNSVCKLNEDVPFVQDVRMIFKGDEYRGALNL